MSRMNDKQFTIADKLTRELHSYLEDLGDDNDEFFDIWPALENYVQQQNKRNSKDGR